MHQVYWTQDMSDGTRSEQINEISGSIECDNFLIRCFTKTSKKLCSKELTLKVLHKSLIIFISSEELC